MRRVDPVKHAEKRRDILDAAKRCFARDGLRGASMSSICAEAGISPGHLYHYFDSKNAILIAITGMIMEEVAEHFGRTFESPDALAALMAGAMLDKAPTEAGGHPLMLDMLADAGRNGDLAAILQDHSARMRAMLAEVLRKGQVQGRIDAGLDPSVTAAVLIAAVDGSRVMGLRHPGLDRAETSRTLRALISRLLAPPGHADPPHAAGAGTGRRRVPTEKTT